MAYSVVFLDRDGTIVADSGYPSDPAAVELLPGAAPAIRALNELDIPVVVVTNQSGIGRGLVTAERFEAVQREVERRLAEAGARIDAVYHCPHDPTRVACRCRKPGTELFERAARDLGSLELRDAVYIGDRLRDVQPGIALGGRAILVTREAVAGLPSGCESAADLAAAVELLAGARRSGTREPSPP